MTYMTILELFGLFSVGVLGGCLLKLWRQYHVLLSQHKALQEIDHKSQQQLSDLNTKYDQLALKEQQQAQVLATTKYCLEKEQANTKEQSETLQTIKQQMNMHFEVLAQKILDEKSKAWQLSNQKEMTYLLDPVKQQLRDFAMIVQQSYEKESKDRVALSVQVQQLQRMNHQLSDEASNLTQALKGNVKQQGCWGELILEKALQLSGLQSGREYITQIKHTGLNNEQLQPDVIVNLPENRSVIIDAKVSLQAYEEYLRQDNSKTQLEYLEKHLLSIRTHIKQLSSKNYTSIPGINTVDFVLLFMPIESAFVLALEHERNLLQFALEKNIVLVTPSTLLASLRTIENLWRVDKQNKNALQIAEKAGGLYDKFASLCHDLTDLGKRLASTQSVYEQTMKKLQGKGNLLTRVEQLKAMGAKTNKQSLMKEGVSTAMNVD